MHKATNAAHDGRPRCGRDWGLSTFSQGEQVVSGADWQPVDLSRSVQNFPPVLRQSMSKRCREICNAEYAMLLEIQSTPPLYLLRTTVFTIEHFIPA